MTETRDRESDTQTHRHTDTQTHRHKLAHYFSPLALLRLQVVGEDDDLTDEAMLAAAERAELEAALPEDLRLLLTNIEGDVEKEEDVNRVSFEIKGSAVQQIQKRLLKDLEYPLLVRVALMGERESVCVCVMVCVCVCTCVCVCVCL